MGAGAGMDVGTTALVDVGAFGRDGSGVGGGDEGSGIFRGCTGSMPSEEQMKGPISTSRSSVIGQSVL